ncbi:MAG: efflux RND transporter periplasmic adaptor subunit, partial [Clostridia bacterium]|nr:efflux RND transporter periplasmic adaptor subunit [Clostridia bacterium]
MKRKWQIILGVLVVCIIAVVISSNQNKELEAKLLEVQPTSIEKTFKEDGNIVLNEEHYIYANSEGEITDLPVEEGEYVKQGDILLQLNTTELQFQLQQLKGELKSIQAQESLEHSKLDTDKLKQLYEIGAISKKEYEDALNTLNSDIYSGQIQALKAQIDLVQYKINKSTVYAPNDGIVSKLDIKEGMVIASGLPLMTIYKEDDYLVEVYVLTEDATKIIPSMEVTLIQDNKDEDIIFKGTVEKLASRAEEKTSALG